MEQERKRADDIVKKLIDTHTTISTMESCTSGLIASMITDTEGASAIFPGGYVTYLNETKILNGVDANVIEKYGVYSRECANAMAETAQKNCTQTLPSVSPERPGMWIRTMRTVYRDRYISVSGWGRRIIHMNWRLLCQK